MNDDNIVGKSLGQLGDISKKTKDQVLNEPLETAEKVQEQAGTKAATNQQSPLDNKSGDAAPPGSSDLPSDKDTLEVIKKMYEASDSKVKAPSDKIIQSVIKENPKKNPEELQKLASTRQQLWRQQHTSSYVEPTFNPQKKPREENPTDKAAREADEKEKKKLEELKFEEKKKKELSPFVKQGTHEQDPNPGG